MSWFKLHILASFLKAENRQWPWWCWWWWWWWWRRSRQWWASPPPLQSLQGCHSCPHRHQSSTLMMIKPSLMSKDVLLLKMIRSSLTKRMTVRGDERVRKVADHDLPSSSSPWSSSSSLPSPSSSPSWPWPCKMRQKGALSGWQWLDRAKSLLTNKGCNTQSDSEEQTKLLGWLEIENPPPQSGKVGKWNQNPLPLKVGKWESFTPLKVGK